MHIFNNQAHEGAVARGFASVLAAASCDRSTSSERRRRTRKQAKTLDDGEVQRFLEYVRTRSLSPFSDELAVTLSFWAGLRAAEIAAMPISALLDAQGNIGDSVVVSSHTAKGGSGRTIPMHPMIYNAAKRFVSAHPTIPFVSFSARYGCVKRRKANALVVHFRLMFRAAGLHGCSSHSGRRTFITNLARDANRLGYTLHDVQRLAGHARLDTTQAYIDPTENLGGLVNGLRSIPDSSEGPFFEPHLRAKGGRA